MNAPLKPIGIKRKNRANYSSNKNSGIDISDDSDSDTEEENTR